MLQKSKRLNLKKDFKWVISGKRIDAGLINLFIRTGENTQARLGIALSGKNFPDATDRNRARRLISSAFEKLYQKLPSNINIIALPKQGVIKVKSDELLAQLESKLKNEKIID